MVSQMALINKINPEINNTNNSSLAKNMSLYKNDTPKIIIFIFTFTFILLIIFVVIISIYLFWKFKHINCQLKNIFICLNYISTLLENSTPDFENVKEKLAKPNPFNLTKIY